MSDSSENDDGKTAPGRAPSTGPPLATYQVQQPKPFSFKKPDEWPKWRRRFEQFRKASGLANRPEDQQVSMLLYSLGEDAEEVLDSTNITDSERDSYETVLRQFDDFFKVRKNVIFERAKFNTRSQREGESVEEFITALYHLVETCDYGSMKEEMLQDRIVVEIPDRGLSQKLQMDSKLTLEQAKKCARQKEAVKNQQKQLQGGQEASLAGITKRGGGGGGGGGGVRRVNHKDKKGHEARANLNANAVGRIHTPLTAAQPKKLHAANAVRKDTLLLNTSPRQ